MAQRFAVVFMDDELDVDYIEADYLDPRGGFLGFCMEGDDPRPFLVYSSAAIFSVAVVTQ